MKISIIIPYFNEAKAFNELLPRLIDECSKISIVKSIQVDSFHLVIVDDGSHTGLTFDNHLVFHKIKNSSVKINLCKIRHKLNLGQGAALQTGIKYSLSSVDSDIYITFDSDGQHDPSDIINMLNRLIESEADIIFGNRFVNKKLVQKIPFSRVVILKLALNFERLITQINIGDAHNGFRCFNKKFASTLKIQQNRMAHATEFKQFTSKFRFKYAECPVSVVYTNYSIEKGQTNWGAFRILKDLALVYVFGEEI